MVTEYRSRPREEAAERIECYIIQNKLSVHDRLPSERDMCEMWSINRSTLRSAIRRLTAEGILYSKVGSGTFVAPPKFERCLQDAEVDGFGRMVESAGRRVTTQVVSARICEATKQLSRKMHVMMGHRLFETVRLRYLDEIPVLLVTSYIDADRAPGIDQYDFSKCSLYSTLKEQYGIAICGGEEIVNVTYTDKEESEQLNIPENAPVFYQSGVVFDQEKVPVEYFKAIVRSEYIRFVSTLTTKKPKE
ncbi:GntR family transcriptional regulator [Hydrogenoanaerobacterium saccharovorans]|uniref:GntR family transcriptional regulator n=1 Tax=Hydrogenoanaerobacterium saccharovorans TaxID=474960 RepID=A0A1H8ASI6_9FIRM|nr:GntR family transcriptional regulator [Hydrogenoanaerobacterium saccharovorans]RPF47814.1 GntR family transcriptional regulator [Hydrogenoanaerobacterium saccharovorans]SEM72749.1 GntR family transcriptional regulator [Hydrogenoanaerobacterium saccharovorans]